MYDPSDITPPKISPWDNILSEGYKYTDVQDNGFKILKKDGSCVTQHDTILFGIQTNEKAQCKISIFAMSAIEIFEEDGIKKQRIKIYLEEENREE